VVSSTLVLVHENVHNTDVLVAGQRLQARLFVGIMPEFFAQELQAWQDELHGVHRSVFVE
jgi:hypothetical protein